MNLWNIYLFEYGNSALVRKLIYRGLKAHSEKSAIDTVCKHLKDNVQRGALFAREAKGDDWCAPPKAS